MSFVRPLGLAFFVSVIVCAAIQWVTLKAAGVRGGVSLLPFLAALVAAISGVFALLLRRQYELARGAAFLLVALLALAAGIYGWGVNDLTPGIGGNIGYLLARLAVLHLLLPATAAVPVHWWLLRAAPR
jgi:hypothetical protein